MRLWQVFCFLAFAGAGAANAGTASVVLHFVRHGESEANKQGILQGQCDYPLTPEGRAQAQAVGKALARGGTKYTRIYTSDLTRARDTCEILGREFPAGALPSMRRTHLLRECRFGVREAQKTSYTREECAAIISARLQIPVESVVDSAESKEELDQRQALLVHQIFDELDQGEGEGETPINVLCVTHSAFIRGYLSSRFGITLKSIHNGSVTKVLVRRSADGTLSHAAPQQDDINQHDYMHSQSGQEKNHVSP